MKSLSTDNCSKGTEDQKATRESWTRVTSSKIVPTSSCDSGLRSVMSGRSGWASCMLSRTMKGQGNFLFSLSLSFFNFCLLSFHISYQIGEICPSLSVWSIDFSSTCSTERISIIWSPLMMLDLSKDMYAITYYLWLRKFYISNSGIEVRKSRVLY